MSVFAQRHTVSSQEVPSVMIYALLKFFHNHFLLVSSFSSLSMALIAFRVRVRLHGNLNKFHSHKLYEVFKRTPKIALNVYQICICINVFFNALLYNLFTWDYDFIACVRYGFFHVVFVFMCFATNIIAHNIIHRMVNQVLETKLFLIYYDACGKLLLQLTYYFICFYWIWTRCYTAIF